jgi:hypothetical protein
MQQLSGRKTARSTAASADGIMNLMSSFQLTSARAATRNPAKSKKNRRHIAGFLPCGAPYLTYEWRDRVRNNLLSIEILLFGAVDEKRCSIDLVECTDGTQKLVLTQALPASWLSMSHFASNTDCSAGDGYARFVARKDLVAQLKEDFGHDGHATMKQEFVLPFRVDNFKDLKHCYKGTGDWFDEWPLLEKTKKRNGQEKTKTVGYMKVLHVQMVAEEKIEKLKKKTVTKRVHKAAYLNDGGSSEDSEEEDDGSNSDSSSDDDISYEPRARSRRSTNHNQNYRHQNNDGNNSINMADEGSSTVSFDVRRVDAARKVPFNSIQHTTPQAGNMATSFDTADDGLVDY